MNYRNGKEPSHMKLLRSLLGIALGAALLWAAPAGAQANAPKPLVVSARNLTAQSDTAVAKPGDVIHYSLVFTNVTAGPVRNVQFVDPIPHGLVYVLGSAAADHPVRIEYSIDRGASYTARPVSVEVVDGQRVEKPAPREAYTHVRWTILGTVVPGARVTAEFEAQLGAPAANSKASGEPR